jgi:ribosomal protein S18 acetylase RimI-like enzyme
MVELRPYEPGDEAELWDRKRAFERGIGAGTGGESKAETYEAKLTADYREEWLSWVGRCVDEQSDCVVVAVEDEAVVGYVFVLPESLAFVWDGAVLNELYVDPDYRGTGVADDLLASALSTAREQSLPLDRLLLDVDRHNERARAFYERHGFEHWGEMVSREL